MEETEGKLQMLLSPRKKGLDSLFKEVRVYLRRLVFSGKGGFASRVFFVQKPVDPGTQFDKIMTRYEYWEVLSPPSCVLQQGISVYVCILFLLSSSCAAGSETIGSTSSQVLRP